MTDRISAGTESKRSATGYVIESRLSILPDINISKGLKSTKIWMKSKLSNTFKF